LSKIVPEILLSFSQLFKSVAPTERGIRIRRLLMTAEIIFIFEESIEGGFEAGAPAHSIYT
jgi:hypothetical protein